MKRWDEAAEAMQLGYEMHAKIEGEDASRSRSMARWLGDVH